MFSSEKDQLRVMKRLEMVNRFAIVFNEKSNCYNLRTENDENRLTVWLECDISSKDFLLPHSLSDASFKKAWKSIVDNDLSFVKI